MVTFGNSWDVVLAGEFEKPYYLSLRQTLISEYGTRQIYPPMHDIYAAFKATDYDSVKAVILGQDPYHGEAQAHGLSFSVRGGVKRPPSLENICKEIAAETGADMTGGGDLTKWAQQGVLLLNAVLTVRAGQAASHRGIGWETFTDNVIRALNRREKPVIFLLWGGFARGKKTLIDPAKHTILECAHPSPLSAYNGFFGCGHFVKTNEILKKMGSQPIDWTV